MGKVLNNSETVADPTFYHDYDRRAPGDVAESDKGGAEKRWRGNLT